MKLRLNVNPNEKYYAVSPAAYEITLWIAHNFQAHIVSFVLKLKHEYQYQEIIICMLLKSELLLQYRNSFLFGVTIPHLYRNSVLDIVTPALTDYNITDYNITDYNITDYNIVTPA